MLVKEHGTAAEAPAVDLEHSLLTEFFLVKIIKKQLPDHLGEC